MTTAYTKVLTDGGTITIYKNNDGIGHSVNPRTVNKDVTINVYGDNNFTVGGTHSVTVDKEGSLTINGKNVTFGNYVVVNGILNVNATNVTASNGLAIVAGTLNVSANTTVNSNGKIALSVRPNATVNLNGTFKNAKNIVVTDGGYTKQDDDKDPVVNVLGGTYSTTSDAFVVDKGYELKITNAKVNAGERFIHLSNGKATISNGEFTAKAGTGIYVDGTSEDTSLTVTGGTVTTKTTGKYALSLDNPNATYDISGGTFESTATKGMVAIELGVNMFDTKTGKLAVKGILTGGKYLNNIALVIKNTVGKDNYDPATDLVAEGYEVKEVTEGKKTYKVVVSTKAENDKKPAAKPEEQAPNTYDAGLVYMGLALSAIGASVVSVRKLRNN